MGSSVVQSAYSTDLDC